MKDIRSELAQIIYEKPIYPKNRYLKKVPPKHADYKRDVIDKQVALMHKRGHLEKVVALNTRRAGRRVHPSAISH